VSFAAYFESWWLYSYAGLVSVGILIDKATPTAMKEAIARVLALKGWAAQREFEYLVISNLLGFFVSSETKRVRVLRVFCFISLPPALVVMALAYLDTGEIVRIWALAPILSLPLDIVSLYITKWLFFEKRHPFWRMTVFVVIDILLSAFVTFTVYYIYGAADLAIYGWTNDPTPFGDFLLFFMAGLALNLFCSLLISLLQITALIGGLAVKILSLIDLLYENGLEKAARQPMTLTFALTGLVGLAAEALGWSWNVEAFLDELVMELFF